MIKLFFADLDGTFLYIPNSDRAGVTEENLASLDVLKENNIRLMLATGRHHTFLPRVLGDTSLRFDTIGFCGAEVYLDGEVLFSMDFTSEEVLALVDHFSAYDYDATIHFTTLNNDWIHYDVTSPLFERAKNFQSNGIPTDRRSLLEIGIRDYLKEERDSPIIRLSFWFSNIDDNLSYLDLLNEAFPNQYTIVRSSPRELQIMKNNMNKGKGIQMIADHLNIPLDEIAVIGDSENDLGMFELIPYSFCMSHADKKLQAKVKYSVDSFAEAVEILVANNDKEN